MKKLSDEIIRQHKGISFTGVTTPFVCYDSEGRIFMAKRSQNARDEWGRWDCGSGGLKVGQSIEENMRRELMEEYGTTPLKVDFIGYFDLFRTLPDGTPTHWVAIAHAVKVDPKTIKIMEPTMVDESGWFTLDNLPSPLHSAFESVFLPKLQKKLANIIQKNTTQTL